MIKIPKVSLAPENKVKQFTEFPKLTLDHGERALILCIEPEPTVEFKHVLRAPEIGPDGKVLKEERKKQNGDLYEATVTEFMGQHLCFGDYATVEENGIDPENCPTCRAASEEQGIDAPTQHYAMHVIKYSLQPGGWTLRDPYNVDLVAWVFSPNRLNTLIDLATEWGSLDEHDLKLGPCENKKFQKYDINVSAKAEWRKDEARQKVTAQTYTNNQADDLSTLIARRISKADALNDVQKVLERLNQVNSRPATNIPVSDKSTSAVSEPEVNTDTGEIAEAPKKTMDLSEIMKDL